MTGSNSTTDGFYDYQKEKSLVKSLIVTEFFKAYFPIINSRFQDDFIWYIDLFCGPGCYDNGEPSTPLKLLDTINAFTSDAVRNKLRIVFNDRNAEYIRKLHENISTHPVLPKLKYQPLVLNRGAAEIDLSPYTQDNVPIFSFVDPWGYKDVSSSQVWKLIKNKGSDCVLFFNANRILQDVSKPANANDFVQIFGDNFDAAKQIQRSLKLTQRQKADLLLKLFSKNLYDTIHRSYGSKFNLFLLPFFIKADDKEKISHFIVFISKSHKAVEEMKKVMINYSNSVGEQLGFDSKDSMQVSLFSRTDNCDKVIISVMKEAFLRHPEYHTRCFDVNGLAKVLDEYAMATTHLVLPYSKKDVKLCVEQLYRLGCVGILCPDGKQIRSPITYERLFKINKRIEEI